MDEKGGKGGRGSCNREMWQMGEAGLGFKLEGWWEEGEMEEVLLWVSGDGEVSSG